MKKFSKTYETNLNMINKKLRVGESFDILVKHIKIADKKATFYCLDGFTKDDILERMFRFISTFTKEQMSDIHTAEELLNSYITYIESSVEENLDTFTTFILSGAVGMIVEGFDKAIIIDSRTYPARNVQEPESDKVLRGSHEGFVETIIFNTALLRRKIRSTDLTLKSHQIGTQSKTDIVICYLEGAVDKKLLKKVVERVNSIDVKSLAMSQESLRECLIPHQAWNPFPKVRYTERPDTAAASIYDGNIIIFSDGSPSAMIIPTGVFDFFQDINDFYFPPLVGTFIRYVRVFSYIMTFFLVPTWYLITLYESVLPEWVNIFQVKEPNEVPIIFQLLIVEFVIDILRLASLNTPSALSNSFSVVAALVLGEFAIKSGLFVSEVVLFMAFVAISNFTQPSYELGYAIKISRIFVLICTALFHIWGYSASILIVMIIVVTTKTISGYTYLYPLIPLNWKALSSLLIRKSLKCKYK